MAQPWWFVAELQREHSAKNAPRRVRDDGPGFPGQRDWRALAPTQAQVQVEAPIDRERATRVQTLVRAILEGTAPAAVLERHKRLCVALAGHNISATDCAQTVAAAVEDGA